MTITMNHIRLLENLKECYQVKMYYLGSKSIGLTESESNELKLQKLLITKEVETISIKLAQMYVQYDNIHFEIIKDKTNSSMQNGDSKNGED